MNAQTRKPSFFNRDAYLEFGRRVKHRIRTNDQIRRVVQFYWAWEGRRDKRRLERRFPKLLRYAQESSRISPDLRPAYKEYTSRVSEEGAAISFQLAIFLTVLCEITGSKRILDLGSGFSSWLLRTYGATAPFPTEVWSVDDDPVWLERTREFLLSQGLSTENLATWESFSKELQAPFDLIVHDLSALDFRAQVLDKVLTLGHPSSLIVLDDLHKPSYRAAVAKKLQRHNRKDGTRYKFYSLRAWTKDSLSVGRYSGLLAGERVNVSVSGFQAKPTANARKESKD